MDKEYQWTSFYEALADQLLQYKDKREELYEIIKKVASEQKLMKYLHFEKEEWWGPRNHQIDPFSVMAAMNRGTTDANRTLIAKVLASTFNITVKPPTEFKGIPYIDNRKSFFGGNDQMWDLFIHAIESAKTNEFSHGFINAFNNSIAVNGNGLASVTSALFWIRPTVFMPQDKNSRSYVTKIYDIKPPSEKSGGEGYVQYLKDLKSRIEEISPGTPFMEISHTAWAGKDPSLETDNQNSQEPLSNETQNSKSKILPDKNIILSGTPGTGKTYSSILYAVAIVEEKTLLEIKEESYDEVFKRYLNYKDNGLIAFTTFHQSYSYEEFIEGIRPVLDSEESAEATHDIKYEYHDGVFKAFCDKAGTPTGNGNSVDLGIGKSPTVWKVSLESTGDNPTRTECLENDHIRIGWDSYGENITDATDFNSDGGKFVLNAFYNKMQIGDIVLSCYSSKTVDAIGVVMGEPYWNDNYPHYKRVRNVKWLVKGINEDIVDLNAGKNMTLAAVYKLAVSPSDVLQILRKNKPEIFSEKVKIPNRVFIIDEINRGNISKIFGELITLIEPSKRINAKEEQRATLPYSGTNFGVPDNVYLIGTMNTADRSIALIDTALRRRFSFIGMKPDSSLLKDVFVEIIDIEELLDTLNKRITVLLDNEHTIGHSYLLPLIDDPSIKNLANIFRFKIIPLLQEYFYDDYEKIQLILGDNQKPDDSTRFIIKRTDSDMLFGNAEINIPEYYEINRDAFMRIDAYAFF